MIGFDDARHAPRLVGGSFIGRTDHSCHLATRSREFRDHRRLRLGFGSQAMVDRRHDELLEALLAPVGLRADRNGNRVRVTPR